MKYHNYGYGQSIQFVHIHRDKDGNELPVVMEFDADGTRTKKPSDGKLATSEILCFWLGFGWGAVSCCGVVLGALSRGWLEAWL
jgi:hypothetical protein